MRRCALFLALLCFIPLPVWAMQLIPFRPPAAAPAGDCTTNTCLAVMDFEGSACADGDAGGEGERGCTLAGSANADCGIGTGPCPLEQSNSGRLGSTSDAIYNVNLGARTTGVDTLDFVFELEGTSTDGSHFLIGFASSSSDYECVMRTSANSVATVIVWANSEHGSSVISTTTGTPYWGRLNYDIANDDCTLYVWDDTWGGNPVSGSPATALGNIAGSVTGWRATRVNPPDFVVDDIALCDESLGDTTTKCRD